MCRRYETGGSAWRIERVGRNAAIHHQMHSALPYWASILRKGVPQGRAVRRVRGQHLIGKRQTLGRHDQCNQRPDAVAALVAAIAKAAFVSLIIRRRRLKIGAGQITKSLSSASKPAPNRFCRADADGIGSPLHCSFISGRWRACRSFLKISRLQRMPMSESGKTKRGKLGVRPTI